VLKDSVSDPGAVARQRARDDGAEVSFVYSHALNGYAAAIREAGLAPVGAEAHPGLRVLRRPAPLARPVEVLRLPGVGGRVLIGRSARGSASAANGRMMLTARLLKFLCPPLCWGYRRRVRRLRAEGGWSLIELMVVILLMLVVGGAVLKVLDATNDVGANEVERPVALTEAQTGVARMDRELRDAYRLDAAVRSDKVDVVTVARGSSVNGRRIVYDCSVASPKGGGLKACERREYPAPDPNVSGLPAAPDESTRIGPPTIIIDRVQNGASSDPIFTPRPNATAPTFLGVTVKVPARGERPGSTSSVTFDDGIYLRNMAMNP
jgi:hypothetical protein